jgi:hypothetical protein
MGKVAYLNRCILMDNLHIPSSGSTTPMPRVVQELKSPIMELIPIGPSPGSSCDKGKGRAIKTIDEGKLEGSSRLV